MSHNVQVSEKEVSGSPKQDEEPVLMKSGESIRDLSGMGMWRSLIKNLLSSGAAWVAMMGSLYFIEFLLREVLRGEGTEVSYLARRLVEFSAVLVSITIALVFLSAIIKATYSRQVSRQKELLLEIQEKEAQFLERLKYEIRVLIKSPSEAHRI